MTLFKKGQTFKVQTIHKHPEHKDTYDIEIDVAGKQGCARPTFHFETETEIFGCGYQNSRLRLRLLVVGIKSQD